MLGYFKIKNFKSIVEETIDFKSDKRKPNSYNEDSEEIIFLQNKKNKKYIPLSIFWGANASGKTNIIKAIATFSNIVVANILEEPNIEKKYNPNKLSNNLQNTFFEIEVNIENKDYIYSLEYNEKEIILEKLIVDSKDIFSINNLKPDFKNIAGKEESLFNEKNLKEFFEKSCLRENKQIITFLSKSIKEYPSLNNYMDKFLNFILKNLRIFPNNNFPSGLAINMLSISNEDGELQNSFDKIATVLRDLDISIEKMEFKRNNLKLEENQDINLNKYSNFDCIGINSKMLVLDNITTFHKNINNELIPFKFRQDESQGTQILFGLIGIILKVLDDGAVLIINELEQSLHPLLLIQIIKMFKSKYWNKTKQAQLIFTTHNTDILDDDILRTTEINIVKKTIQHGTNVFRLDNYEDKNGKKIRNVANFRKQYLSGVYSGIPFPTL